MSIDDVRKSGYQGRIGIRYKVPSSPFCRYNLELDQCEAVTAEFISKGAKADLLTYGEAAPDEYVTMQGEVMRDDFLYLHYSTYKAQMRTALSMEPKYAKGLTVKLLLQHYCDPASYDDIQELLDNYQDHAIEFSCYSVNLGSIPHRNTLIWEVRSF